MKYHKSISSEKYRKRFLELAEHISTWSKDTSTKVGAVLITSDAKVAATGYNGLPISCPDSKIEDREFKIRNVIHAEMNAISNRYFLNEISFLFVSKPMCPDCVKLITANHWIHGVCWRNDDTFSSRWNSAESIQMLERHFSNKLMIDSYNNYSYIFKG